MPDIAQDNSKWTTDQDGAIIKLKKDKLSWADIGLAIGSTKGLVRNRHKFLEAQIRAAGLDPAKIGESWAEDMRRQGQDIPSPEKPMSSPEKQKNDEEFPMMGLAGIVEEDEQEKEVEKKEEQAKQPSPTGSGGSKTTHKAPTASPVVVVQDSPKPGNIKLSGRVIEKHGVRFAEVADSSSSSGSEDDSSDSHDSDGEREEQKRFLYHEYWSELYPKQKTYKPDRHWTEGDCKVLAVIEAKDEALKYKRMQADFFNATGRMISEEIIKHKMQK